MNTILNAASWIFFLMLIALGITKISPQFDHAVSDALGVAGGIIPRKVNSTTLNGSLYDKYSDGNWYHHGDAIEPGNRVACLFHCRVDDGLPDDWVAPISQAPTKPGKVITDPATIASFEAAAATLRANHCN